MKRWEAIDPWDDDIGIGIGLKPAKDGEWASLGDPMWASLWLHYLHSDGLHEVRADVIIALEDAFAAWGEL